MLTTLAGAMVGAIAYLAYGHSQRSLAVQGLEAEGGDSAGRNSSHEDWLKEDVDSLRLRDSTPGGDDTGAPSTAAAPAAEPSSAADLKASETTPRAPRHATKDARSTLERWSALVRRRWTQLRARAPAPLMREYEAKRESTPSVPSEEAQGTTAVLDAANLGTRV